MPASWTRLRPLTVTRRRRRWRRYQTSCRWHRRSLSTRRRARCSRGSTCRPWPALCGELALVADAEALPAALERVAAALGAHGVIVWLADPDRRQLRAAATSGYERRLVERLGAVDVADDNPTAKAFRTAKPVISPARNSRAGSIAVPIIGTAGVTGVLSAELTATDPTTLPEVAAAAGVVAAQLAGLLAPAAVPVVALDEAAGGAPV